MKVKVLAFHHISSGRKDTRQYPGISTPYLKFIFLILALRICRYKFCLFNELSRSSKRNIIVLNFDDAYDSVYKKAFPILSFFGIKAHVCITGESLAGPEREHQLTLMNIQEATELHQKGWDFINHGMRHIVLVNRTEKELDKEITATALAFRNAGLPLNPNYFCLPEGKSDVTTQRFIRNAGYSHILTTREDSWRPAQASFLIPRINISSQPLWYALYKINFKYDHLKTKFKTIS